ncbi:Primase zinc finger family protein [Candida parapsilosis]|uniref:Zf-primase domain-containing protein n=2 Tax=Candida parapsilosis TaxID=5480 RepID=G8BFV5_CANPC|nr:uncharacterized protein CPAR2_203820 [Candida parapsilosis]KAF6055112.1 Primase zinc finger family protein [Candida parapsilosis]KAF6055865.1 Primase zinc finger family protein [Candida parapsilosis]KAF6058795.1 Primase zinc finger family protein [Candida parapsilosis]KAF6067552.1 Primase zinc finger family protein [Candida parapsilosis]KAI5901452.1 hypothetical protein K4G60_g589 [Candida parapsilosis]
MIDPRDEIVNKDDLLSDDSSDELKDLYKEFELKYQAIKKKELEKKNKQNKSTKHAHDTSVASVPRSPSKREKSFDPPAETKHEVDLPLPKTKKASEFLSKLYDANLTKSQEKYEGIDYSLRKFEFDFTNYESKPRDVVDDLCPLSGLSLRRRYSSRQTVDQLITNTDGNMKILKVGKLLAKTNKSNNYREPTYTNWCLVGFVLHKSEVLFTKNEKKYMKLRIGDFQNSVELLLFDGAFEKNHKLQQGDLILVLNPIVNKYEFKVNEHVSKTGFNLKLDGSNVNSILEIGAIRDFGICRFVKRGDNQRCTNVVDITKQHLCDIHLDNKFRHSTRMELNGISLRSPTKNKTKVFLNMNKNSNSKVNGFISEYNEDSTFTTSGSGKIDSRKYQDPKLLQTQLKRRKLQNDRANELLERKLSKLSSRNPIVESLNMKHPTNNEKTRQDSLPNYFPSSLISKIGFDPTNQDNDKSKQTHPERLQELYELSAKCSTKKSLISSSEDKRSKAQKWQKNINTLKKYDSKLMQSNLNLSKPVVHDVRKAMVSPNRVTKTNRVVLSDDGSDNINDDNDDDDLNIDFGNADMRAKYEKAVGR